MKIYPPIIPPSESPLLQREISNGERKLFEEFRSLSGYENWFVIHSLLLPDHRYKLVSEVDFVLVGPLGLYCLEVKGTKVSLDTNGIWEYGYSKSHEGPFKQASSAMFSLISRLKDNFKFDFDIDRMITGFGVIFTQNNFNIYSVEHPKEIILDMHDISSESDFLKKYIARLSEYWSKKKSRMLLLDDQIEQLRQSLRPDFEIAKMLKYSVEITDDNFTALTRSQYKALDYTMNNPRIIFDGGAGTGKTFLAMESAKRHAMMNQTVLFLCFNPLLAAYLNQNVKFPGVMVTSIHEFFYNNLTDKKKYKPFPDKISMSSTLYTETLPQDFVSVYESENSFPQYDVLLIDEAQDLISYSYLMALEYVIKGGWENGIWRLFLDSKFQINVQGIFDMETFSAIKKYSPFNIKLTENCRNTSEVIRETKILTGLDFSSDSMSSGIAELKYYSSQEEQFGLISHTLSNLLRENQPGDITILTERIFSSSIAHSKLSSKFNIQLITRSSAIKFPFNKITVSSPSDFKGLENRFIIYMDIDSFEDSGKYNKYVSITRARFGVYLFVDKKIISQIQNASIQNYSLIRGE